MDHMILVAVQWLQKHVNAFVGRVLAKLAQSLDKYFSVVIWATRWLKGWQCARKHPKCGGCYCAIPADLGNYRQQRFHVFNCVTALCGVEITDEVIHDHAD